MLSYEYKIVNTDANVDKISDLLYRKDKGGDKMISSFVKRLLNSRYNYHKGKFRGLISQMPGRTKQERINSIISTAAL